MQTHVRLGYAALAATLLVSACKSPDKTPPGADTSVAAAMKGQLTLEDHGGRTILGVYSRVAGRLLALAAGIWHNWLTGQPNKRSLIATTVGTHASSDP